MIEITLNDMDSDTWYTVEHGLEADVRASMVAGHPVHALIDEAITSKDGISQGTYEIDGDEYTTRVIARTRRA